MELRLFGSSKRFVTRIGQGTWFIENADRHSAIDALRRGLDLGMTHIDTAELYGGAPRKSWWAKRSPDDATKFSLSRRCSPKMPPGQERAWRVSSRSPVSIPTGWTVTCCIGAAGTH